MDHHIKDVLKRYINQDEKIGDVYYSQKIRDYWKTNFAESIVSRTTSMQYHNGKLTIKVDSAALRHELFMNRKKIAERINNFLEEDKINVIDLR